MTLKPDLCHAMSRLTFTDLRHAIYALAENIENISHASTDLRTRLIVTISSQVQSVTALSALPPSRR